MVLATELEEHVRKRVKDLCLEGLSGPALKLDSSRAIEPGQCPRGTKLEAEHQLTF